MLNMAINWDVEHGQLYCSLLFLSESLRGGGREGPLKVRGQCGYQMDWLKCWPETKCPVARHSHISVLILIVLQLK